MTDIYLVAVGYHADCQIVRAFHDQPTAEQWALAYNNTHPWRHDDDRARVESVPFTPAGQPPPPA